MQGTVCLKTGCPLFIVADPQILQDALALPAGKPGAVFFDQCDVSLRKYFKEFIAAGCFLFLPQPSYPPLSCTPGLCMDDHAQNVLLFTDIYVIS